MPPKLPKYKLEVRTLLSQPIAPGLVQGQLSHARRIYSMQDSVEIRKLMSELCGDRLKIFSFEDKTLIGKGKQHVWNYVLAAHVLNRTLERECIIIQIYDPAVSNPVSKVLEAAERANWPVVR